MINVEAYVSVVIDITIRRLVMMIFQILSLQSPRLSEILRQHFLVESSEVSATHGSHCARPVGLWDADSGFVSAQADDR